MKAHKPLSILLSLAILLSCIGWTPTLADTASPAKSAQPSATEPTQLPEAAEQEATRGKDHVARLHGEEGDHLNNLVFLNEDGSKTLYLYDHPVKYRDESGGYTRISGHGIVISGYVYIGSEVRFIARDPFPVNQGQTYLISYEKLCNGQNPQDWESSDYGIWETALVPMAGSYYDTIDYYFNQS